MSTVEREPPDDAGKIRAFVRHLPPAFAAIELEQGLLHAVFGVFAVAEDAPCDAIEKLRVLGCEPDESGLPVVILNLRWLPHHLPSTL